MRSVFAGIAKRFRALPRLALIIVLLTGAGGGYLFFRIKQQQPLLIETVMRRTLVEEVLVTGKTEAKSAVALGFERTGKVARVYAAIGDAVEPGRQLVSLENGDLLAQLLETQATLDAERAKLEELKRGARPEEIRIREAKVANAIALRDDAKENMRNVLGDGYTKADDAIRNKVDQFFSNPRGNSPQLTFQTSDPSLKNEIESERRIIEERFAVWQAELARRLENEDLKMLTRSERSHLERIKLLLEQLALILSTLTPGTSLTQATIDDYRADVSTARTNVNAAVTNLSAAEEKLNSATTNATVAENELALTRAGATREQIAAQEAVVKRSQANVQSAEAQFQKSIIRSPIAGVVTRQDAKVGEIIGANTPLVSVMSDLEFEIEVNVPEVDIGKINAGNIVTITLDAFPDELFGGHVASVDPAETIIDGVVNFRVIVSLDELPDGIKNGLTANLAIETTRRENALSLPQTAIIENDRGVFVKKFAKEAAEESPIVTGIRSRDGFTEIISGINEGETVVNIGIRTAPENQ